MAQTTFEPPFLSRHPFSLAEWGAAMAAVEALISRVGAFEMLRRVRWIRVVRLSAHGLAGLGICSPVLDAIQSCVGSALTCGLCERLLL